MHLSIFPGENRLSVGRQCIFSRVALRGFVLADKACCTQLPNVQVACRGIAEHRVGIGERPSEVNVGVLDSWRFDFAQTGDIVEANDVWMSWNGELSAVRRSSQCRYPS